MSRTFIQAVRLRTFLVLISHGLSDLWSASTRQCQCCALTALSSHMIGKMTCHGYCLPYERWFKIAQGGLCQMNCFWTHSSWSISCAQETVGQ